MRFEGEEADLSRTVEVAEKWGYGNVIDWLKTAWSKKMQIDPRWPHPRQIADEAAGHICVWCKTDSRTGKKVRPEKEVSVK